MKIRVAFSLPHTNKVEKGYEKSRKGKDSGNGTTKKNGIPETYSYKQRYYLCISTILKVVEGICEYQQDKKSVGIEIAKNTNMLIYILSKSKSFKFHKNKYLNLNSVSRSCCIC